MANRIKKNLLPPPLPKTIAEPVRAGRLNGRTVNSISDTPLSAIFFKFFAASICLGAGLTILNYSQNSNDREYSYLSEYMTLQSCCCLWLFSRLMSSEDF